MVAARHATPWAAGSAAVAWLLHPASVCFQTDAGHNSHHDPSHPTLSFCWLSQQAAADFSAVSPAQQQRQPSAATHTLFSPPLPGTTHLSWPNYLSDADLTLGGCSTVGICSSTYPLTLQLSHHTCHPQTPPPEARPSSSCTVTFLIDCPSPTSRVFLRPFSRPTLFTSYSKSHPSD